MSVKAIETVLTRALCDVRFAALLVEQPQLALAGYDLTAEEVAKFESLSNADFEAFDIPALEEHVAYGVRQNHNQSVLKVYEGIQQNHNQTALKVRGGVKYNHNETALKVCKGIKYNHNQTVLKVK